VIDRLWPPLRVHGRAQPSHQRCTELAGDLEDLAGRHHIERVGSLELVQERREGVASFLVTPEADEAVRDLFRDLDQPPSLVRVGLLEETRTVDAAVGGQRLVPAALVVQAVREVDRVLLRPERARRIAR